VFFFLSPGLNDFLCFLCGWDNPLFREKGPLSAKWMRRRDALEKAVKLYDGRMRRRLTASRIRRYYYRHDEPGDMFPRTKKYVAFLETNVPMSIPFGDSMDASPWRDGEFPASVTGRGFAVFMSDIFMNIPGKESFE
jgi:hypothetical protein